MATCISADGVIDAANVIKSDSALIHLFTHGTSAQTVQLGVGSPTPVLRKLVHDIQMSVQEAVDSIVPAGEAAAITQTYIDSLFAE